MNIITSSDPEFLAFVGKQESQFLMPMSHWLEEIMERLKGGGKIYGSPMPWQKTHDKIRFRPGEITLWAGVNGHGKSIITSQTALWLSRNQRVCIASMEMPPASTATRMIRQAAGCEQPSRDYVKKFTERVEDKIWIYDQVDTVKSERILGLLSYSAEKLGIEHVFVDSLVKCGIPPDDYAGQTVFIDRLCWAAKRLKIHIHLIHHVRKGENEERAPGKFDTKGAGEITDLVDNVIIVHRNKRKERLSENNSPDYNEDEQDAVLYVCKQRHGEWEGAIGLWWHGESQQFIPRYNAGPMPWPSPEGQQINRAAIH